MREATERLNAARMAYSEAVKAHGASSPEARRAEKAWNDAADNAYASMLAAWAPPHATPKGVA